MIRAKYTKLIDDYRDDNLTFSEKQEFERALKNNQQFNDELNLHIDLDDALADEQIVDFRATLIDAQHDYNKSQKHKPNVIKMYRKYRYAVASVVLLLMIVGSIMIINPRNYSNEKLFQMYYKRGDAIGITRSGDANVVDAVMKFHEGDYQNACTLFGELLKEDASNIAVRYYYGIASIETQNYDRAIQQFRDVIEDDNNLYVEYAQWYLGLAYLINKEDDKALTQIKAIASNPNHFYSDEASKLYDKIKKAENK